ncbi:multidrug effflux MFS transporter [Rhodobacteraceae bacterium M382]|nr:multidrug effflux MFS transporter [Rhodobacteraceae bacterium M382]
MTSAFRSPPHLATLILMTALAVLSLNLFLPSLPEMALEFGVEYSVMNLAVSGFMLVSAVLQLVLGPLSDRYGRRPILLGALAVFTLASLGCVWAEDIRVFLAFRLLQGGIISGAVLSRAVIRDMAPEQEAVRLIGLVAMVMAVAPMLGPALGGALDVAFGWRSGFVVLAGAGAAMFCLCWVDLGETNSKPIGTFAAQFSAYPTLIASPVFWSYALCLTFSVGAFYAFLGGGPLVAAEIFGLSPVAVGVGMGSITGGFMFGSFLSGRLNRRWGPTGLMIAGRVVACSAMAAGLFWYLLVGPSALGFFVPVVGVGIGNGLTLPAATAGVMSVNPRLAGSASGLSGALMVAGGAAFAGMAAALLPPGGSVLVLFVLMLLVSLGGLLAACAVMRLRPGVGDMIDCAPKRS